MYYEETFVAGELSYRTTPNGIWQVVPLELVRLRQQNAELLAALKAYVESDYERTRPDGLTNSDMEHNDRLFSARAAIQKAEAE